MLFLAPPTVAELVRAGDAGGAYALLAERIDEAKTERGARDTRFWADLLRYLRCEALGPKLAGDDALAEGRALLDAELLRLARQRREERPSGPEAWIAGGRLSWKLPAAPASAKMIRWPVEDERWSDETPVLPAPEVKCGRAAPVEPKKESERLSAEAEAMRTLRLALPPGTPTRVALLLDEAVLRARLADWPEVWVLVRLTDEEAKRPGAGPLAPSEQAELALLAGLAAERDGRDGAALEQWDRAAALPLSKEVALFVDVRRQRLLVAAGRLREARALLDRYNGAPGDLGRYLRYRNALVRFQTNDEGALLAMARQLLGKRRAADNAADPIARASEELVYLQLARHPMTPETVEVVESLGPPDELLLRMEALGTIAVERGRPALGVQVFQWLMARQPAGYTRPIYLSRLAAAGAGADDLKVFQESFQALVEETLAPPPKEKGRRAARKKPIEWDRQILLATRDSVEPLVARKRFAALKVMVDELQKYLRAKKPPWPELTELYRLASTQLPTGPRAYAETVGSEHAPVWLGEVTLDRPRQSVPEPTLILPRLEGPETLVCLPDGRGRCERWLGPPAKAKRERRADAR